MKAMDDGFRQQLETKELSHADKLREISEQYELRLAEEQHKVLINDFDPSLRDLHPLLKIFISLT